MDGLGRIEKKGALIFLLDSSYLLPLKVFAYTLRHALAEWTGDIVVLSNDATLADDRFVQRFASRTIILSDDDIRRLHAVRSDAVQEQYLLPEIGKYTFLKFYCWEDFGYDYHIFADVDMLCLADDFRFDELIGDYDMAVARDLGVSALGQKHTEHISEQERIDTLANLLNGIAEKRWPPRKPINSGIFFAAKRLLGQSTVHGLIERASTSAYSFEQDVIKHYICSVEGLRFRSLPIWYNFLERPMRWLGQERFQSFQDRIRILHYNRLPKPWQMREDEAPWWHGLWWQARNEAEDWIAERSF